MVCDQCGKDKEDVERVIDPYNEDVHNTKVWMYLCKECIQERKDDI